MSSRRRKSAQHSAHVRRAGRPAILNDSHTALLRVIVRERPNASLEEVTRDLCQRGAVRVCSATVRKALRAAGIVKVFPTDQPSPEAQPTVQQPKRYGYTSAHRREVVNGTYNTCLTDAEWALVADLFERPAGGRGMPARLPRRSLVDACCYVLRTGCAWRLLPTSFPHWATVYKSFSRWAAKGMFEAMQDRLREQWRERLGHNAQPSAAVLDAQSTRSSPQGGSVGFDAGKKVKGRKRHLVVDTLGLLLAVSVTAASVQDRDAAPAVVAQACAKAPQLAKLYVDAAYAGACAQTLHAAHGIDVEVVRHPGNRNTGTYHDTAQQPAPAPTRRRFVAQPKRWIVERTHAWGERCRRLVMHHDRSPLIATGWVWFANARILASRLAAPS